MFTTNIKEYKIFASKIPTEKEAQPQIFTSTIFAKDEISARSKINKILNKKHKVKPTKSVILNISEIKENNNDLIIKNYGITYVYRSRKGQHNMYKEFRALSRCDAVEFLYNDMAGRHKAGKHDINIVEVKEICVDDLKRMNVIQFTKKDISFPVFKKYIGIDKVFVPENSGFFN